MSDFIAPEYDSVRRDLKTIEDIEASTLRPLAPKQISGIYRRAELPVPEVIDRCAGISIFGRTLKSWIFSTDIATATPMPCCPSTRSPVSPSSPKR